MIQATSHHIFSQAELAIFRNFSLQQIASPSACWSFEKRACSFWFIWQSANCTFHPRLCLRWVRVWFGKLSTMHFALCTLHYALWNTRALAYDLENCRNFAAIPTPSELGDPSVRERPTLLLPFPHLQRESLPNLTFWGNPKDIFSNSLLLIFPHLQSPILNRSYFLEHFLPPKDNFPHVSRSRVSPNPTFWSTTICWYLLISPFFGSTQNKYSQPPPPFPLLTILPQFTKPSSERGRS